MHKLVWPGTIDIFLRNSFRIAGAKTFTGSMHPKNWEDTELTHTEIMLMKQGIKQSPSLRNSAGLWRFTFLSFTYQLRLVKYHLFQLLLRQIIQLRLKRKRLVSNWLFITQILIAVILCCLLLFYFVYSRYVHHRHLILYSIYRPLTWHTNTLNCATHVNTLNRSHNSTKLNIPRLNLAVYMLSSPHQYS